ncbi:MAG: UPF0182 family protein [Candidatus Lambdaproteobacteria bacterium]|nr:UPF0182 family protein [Candidatus Lambdaproteobacteria bacterium]
MTARRSLWTLVILVLIALYLASSGIELLVEYLWFESVGFSRVFSTVVLAKLGLGIAAGAAALAILFANLAIALRQVGDPADHLPPEIIQSPAGQFLRPRTLLRGALAFSLVIGVLTGMAAAPQWESVLLYLNGGTFGQVDPIFQRDAGFYVFELPFLDKVQSFLWTMGLLSLLGVGFLYFIMLQGYRSDLPPRMALANLSFGVRLHLGLLGAILLIALSWGLYLDRFLELSAQGGLFAGPGYAEINGTLPMLALKAAVVVVCAGIVLFALLRQRYRFLIGAAILLAAVWIGGNVYTQLLQRFVVTPNELEKERPYLKNHIEATRRAFALDRVVERQLTRDEGLTAADIQRNQPTVNNVRLWDHEPLLNTFSQIQEIRTYYDFVGVDNDRYRIDGELRQIMLSPRELNSASLPSRTWVNERLTFTHGYGLAAGPVNRVSEEGLPILFVKDLPPRSTHVELEVKEPALYFGEVSNDYVFVKTRQKEFDFPEGDANRFNVYGGTGGVAMGTAWRRLVFALYLRDVKVLLADDFSDETRILLFRRIGQRVRKIAPFLTFDKDPYLVIHDQRLSWIYDGYTLSTHYPYAERVSELGNYMRNPVKATIDARDGTMHLYLVDTTDPIAQAFARIFPGVFEPIANMPASLRSHLRHPVDYFSVQAYMYTAYHMDEVNTFYNKEDLWEVPVIENKRMQPYYTVMKLPGEKREEFILILPFTPRRKDNLAAWMAARSDGEDYGKLVVYTFPKQKLVFGPKQMVARINQDSEISQQITLWDQSGSNVIRGTLLVIPIEDSLIYVQPLYLKAQEGKIPELKRVIVGYQNQIAMGMDLEDALGRVFGTRAKAALQAPRRTAEPRRQPPGPAPTGAFREDARKAREHYEAMQRAAREGNWSLFGRELEALGRELGKLAP